MHTRSFLPSPRASNVLIAIGFAALGYAMYIRYLLVENSTVGLACDGGLATAQCMLRQITIFLFGNQVFGYAAIALAIAQFVRPNVFTFGAALAVSAMGLVLYNNGLAALSIALLVVSFARPVIVDTLPTEEAKSPRTNPPASSAASR